MAFLSDLKWINGAWVDDYANDTIYGTAENDNVALHGGNDFFNDISGGDDTVNDFSGGGPSGNDVISTGLGNDVVYSSLDSQNAYYGGLGTDHLMFIDSKSGVRVDFAMGTAQNVGFGLVTQIVGFESLAGSIYADVIYGDAGSNTVSGYLGDDLIDGKAGDDRLGGDIGIDQVFGGDGNDYVFGNLGNDYVYGEAGADNVRGDQGDDRVSGGAGDDTLFGDDDNDTMYGDADWDYMYGGTGNDVMFGGTGTDNMMGGDDSDTLEGGADADGLTGGAGNDKFILRTRADSPAATPDLITDFQRGLDKIDVSLIDARDTVAGNQDFTFIGASNFTAAGQLRAAYSASQGVTIVSLNTDNDSFAEMAVYLTGNVTLTATDFSGATAAIAGTSGANTLNGGIDNDVIFGLAGNDKLNGGAGGDHITGGKGRDIMTGGSGADDFDFNSAKEMGRTSSSRDRITDFKHGTDNIDLSTIDANGSAAGNAAFKFLAKEGASFTGVKGQLHWLQIDVAGTANDKTLIEGDVNGDRHADFQIEPHRLEDYSPSATSSFSSKSPLAAGE